LDVDRLRFGLVHTVKTMPTLKNKICCYPGCGLVVQSRYCDKHWKSTQATNNRYASAHRDAGWYNRAAWRNARLSQLRKQPLCQVCMSINIITPATVVDHITPRSDGGADLSQDNLQSLCTSCHNSKTARENGLGSKIRAD
jgi:5-methylcytosine-specific restriction protein A